MGAFKLLTMSGQHHLDSLQLDLEDALSDHHDLQLDDASPMSTPRSGRVSIVSADISSSRPPLSTLHEEVEEAL